MAITVTLDTWEGGTIDLSASNLARPNRFVRMCVVEGIDVTGASGNKFEAMFLASAEVQAKLATDGFAAAYPDYKLQNILLTAISDTQASGRLIYETIVFGQGVPPSTFVLTDGGYHVTRQTNYIVAADGKRIPIQLAWQASDVPFAPAVPRDFVPMSFEFPMRTLQVDALTYGRPTNGQQYLRYVNNATWPTTPPTLPGVPAQGPTALGVGFWRLDEWVSRMYRTGGYYTLSAKATSRVIEDWSDLAILMDTKTGRYIQVGATPEAGQTIIDALFSSDYAFGIFPGSDGGRDTGCARVGPYPTTDFSAIFGF